MSSLEHVAMKITALDPSPLEFSIRQVRELLIEHGRNVSLSALRYALRDAKNCPSTGPQHARTH